MKESTKEKLVRLLDFGDTDTSIGYVSVGSENINYTEENIRFIEDLTRAVIKMDKENNMLASKGKQTTYLKPPIGSYYIHYMYDLTKYDYTKPPSYMVPPEQMTVYREEIPKMYELCVYPSTIRISIYPEDENRIKVIYNIPWNLHTDMRRVFKNAYHKVPVNDKDCWFVEKTFHGASFPRGILYGKTSIVRACYRKIAWILETLSQML